MGTTDQPETTTEEVYNPSEFIGDPMVENKSDITTRIYIQNLNGLNWNRDGGKWPYIIEAMDAIQADISCFSELNVDTNKYSIRKTLETICQRQYLQNNLVLSASKYQTPTVYKPGGTAILARNDITAKIKSHTRDRMGRWASMSLTTSNSRRIRIISAYQVCNVTRLGTNTIASQQTAQIIEDSVNKDTYQRLTPRQAFIQDLQKFILQMQSENEEIVLAGDFNEDITSPSSGMDQLATTCGLVDLFSIRTGTSTLPATYQRGIKRLDYILLSPTLTAHVTAAGYDPFGYRIPSDHRGMYVDFDSEALFNQPLSQLAPAVTRDFVTTSPGVIEKYVTAKMAYLNDHRFFDRLETMEDLDEPDHELAESLDRDLERASFHAARICAKKRQPPWSPQLAEIWAELHFFRLAKSATTNTSANYIPAITHLQRKWPKLPKEVPTDSHHIKEQIQKSNHKLQMIRQQAQQLRDDFLLQRASMYKDMQENGKAKIIQRIIRAESQQKVYQKINYLKRQGNNNLGLSSIKIPRHVSITDTEKIKKLPDTTEEWETITVPEEIERMLLQRNQNHFSQAHGTPFTTDPLQATVGYKANGYSVDLILSGSYEESTLTPVTSLLVKHLQARTTNTINGAITKEDVLGKLRNWHESTTTSPSGLHLGHYHCMWKKPTIPPGEPARDRIIAQQDQLLQATVSLLNYAIRFQHTFRRWTKVVNVLLQKDPGNPRIHRLRIIHLYEADYNLLLAVKWRQAMYNAEQHNILNDGLYGSRPGRSAHDPALLEVLQHEIYRMSMKPGINYDLDAASCFDRIIPNIAAICSRRLGVPDDVIQVNMATLEKAQYHLKTNLGVSDGYYQHHDDTPIYGTGQGSGNSPILWCFVCSALFDALESTGHGATFSSYDNRIKVSTHIVGFVDNCTQRVNKFNNTVQPSGNELINLMTTDVQTWNDLLWASGGMLEQQKCSFHLIQSQWTADGHPFLKGGTDGNQLIIKHAGNQIPTRQVSNYTAHKTLGCYINPAYNNKQAWSNFQQKNNQFATLLESNYFTRSEAWTLYTAFYLPSITYALPITPLTTNQCAILDARFLRSLAPRCGYNRNMAREIRNAPRHVGGGDAAEVQRIVHDGHEEVGGGDQRLLIVELVDGRVVGRLDAHHQFLGNGHGDRALEDL